MLLLAQATAVMWQLVWWSLYFFLFMLALVLYTSAGEMILGMLPNEQSPLARATTGRNDEAMKTLLGKLVPADPQKQSRGAALSTTGPAAAEKLTKELSDVDTEVKRLKELMRPIEAALQAKQKELEELYKLRHEQEQRRQLLTAKHHYAQWNQPVEARAISAARSNPNYGGRLVVPLIGPWFGNKSPLATACEQGDVAAVKLFLSAGASPEAGRWSGLLKTLSACSPLTSAVKGQHAEIVRLLLDAGANPNVAESYGPAGLLWTESPLRAAVEDPPRTNDGKDVDDAIVRLLLEKGADPNTGGTYGPLGSILRTSCLAAAVEDPAKAAIVGVLLEAGASASWGWSAGPFGLLGRGSLMYHAAERSPEIFDRLTTAGASYRAGLDAGPFGLLMHSSCLRAAAHAGHLSVAAALLEKGAEVGVGLRCGPWGLLGTSSPLSCAAEHGYANTCKLLLDAGASAEGGWSLAPFGLMARGTPLYRAAMQPTHEMHEGHSAFEHEGGDLKVVTDRHGTRKTKQLPEGAAVDVLAKAGARLTAGDDVGCGAVASMTPLFAAADSGHTRAIERLSEHGSADTRMHARGYSLLGVHMRTPFEWAVSKGHKEAAAALDVARSAARASKGN